MLPLSQRHKEKPLNKTIPVACTFSSCFNFTKTSGGVRQSWRIPKVLKEFDSEFLSVPILRLPALSVQLFAAPAAAQALLSHCWGTGCSPLQQANPAGAFRILTHSFLPILLTPTHFTLLESLHCSLQVLPHTDRKGGQ